MLSERENATWTHSEKNRVQTNLNQRFTKILTHAVTMMLPGKPRSSLRAPLRFCKHILENLPFPHSPPAPGQNIGELEPTVSPICLQIHSATQRVPYRCGLQRKTAMVKQRTTPPRSHGWRNCSRICLHSNFNALARSMHAWSPPGSTRITRSDCIPSTTHILCFCLLDCDHPKFTVRFTR